MRDAFLATCEDFVDVSYSQRFQDLFCLWIAGLKQDGYFVEFGALSGINVSNSYLMERLGWQGIVAEPHPAFHDQLRANRKARVVTDCVWTTTGETLDFHAVKGKPALSTIGGLDYDDIQNEAGNRENYVLHKVRTISLLDMLNEAGAPKFIDCLSIDTEGSELEILAAFDFDAYRFGAIVVEHGYASARGLIHEVLTNHGYGRLWPELSGHDDFYVHAACLPTQPPSVAAHVGLAQAVQDFDPYEKRGQRLRVLAEMAHGVGDTTLALRALQGAVAELPEIASLHAELARTHEAAGHIHLALRSYAQALQLNPNLAPARRRRDKLLAAQS